MKIKIKPGSRASVFAAVDEIDREIAKIEKNLPEYVRRLTEIGRAEAERRFAEAKYDGTNDVVVTAERTDRGWRIVASGDAVAFIEFGSGVYQPPYPADALVHHTRGTYGRGQGGNVDGWIYKGEGGPGAIPVKDHRGNVKPDVHRTWGNPPAMAMYFAVRAMQQAAPMLAREVFGN